MYDRRWIVGGYGQLLIVYRISPCIMRCFFLAINVAKRHLVLYIDVEFKQIFSSLAVSSAVSSLAVERIGQSACLVSRPIHTIQQDCAFPTSSKQETFTQCWYIVGPPSSTLTQQCSSIGLMCRVCWDPPSYIPADARGTFDNHGRKITPLVCNQFTLLTCSFILIMI